MKNMAVGMIILVEKDVEIDFKPYFTNSTPPVLVSIVSNRLKFSLMPTSVVQWPLIYSQADLDSLGIGTLGGPNGPNESYPSNVESD